MGYRSNGEMEVTVNKEELIAVLKKNRLTHIIEFKEFQEIYLDEVTKGLAKLLKESKKRDPNPATAFYGAIKPELHKEDFDLIIGMLEMSTADTFTITSSDYQNYVLNKWSWTSTFENMKLSYSN